MTSSNLHAFLEKIMNIKILSMGGTSAGVFGSSGADNDTLNTLKQSAVAFAKEYSKGSPDTDTLTRYAQDIEGYLQILQLTNTVSKDTADKLVDELQSLTADDLN